MVILSQTNKQKKQFPEVLAFMLKKKNQNALFQTQI